MKLRILSMSILAASTIGLTACSSMSGSQNSGADVVDESGAYSTGVGQHAGFNGKDLRRQASSEAPHNQTYYFNFDSNRIYGQDYDSVKAQAKYLALHPKATIRLAGNTDERGSREYNIALGERRAKALADLLKMDGVKSSQIQLLSYGQEKPIALGHNEDSTVLTAA